MTDKTALRAWARAQASTSKDTSPIEQVNEDKRQQDLCALIAPHFRALVKAFYANDGESISDFEGVEAAASEIVALCRRSKFKTVVSTLRP